MKNDMIIAFEMMLVANGYKKKDVERMPDIFHELLEYVNSPAYQLLIKKEQDAKSRNDKQHKYN